jgi:hypothetical protein
MGCWATMCRQVLRVVGYFGICTRWDGRVGCFGVHTDSSFHPTKRLRPHPPTPTHIHAHTLTHTYICTYHIYTHIYITQCLVCPPPSPTNRVGATDKFTDAQDRPKEVEARSSSGDATTIGGSGQGGMGPAAAVCCGGWHTCVVTEGGEVGGWVWIGGRGDLCVFVGGWVCGWQGKGEGFWGERGQRVRGVWQLELTCTIHYVHSRGFYTCIISRNRMTDDSS